jgi:hypothetical protein
MSVTNNCMVGSFGRLRSDPDPDSRDQRPRGPEQDPKKDYYLGNERVVSKKENTTTGATDNPTTASSSLEPGTRDCL